jgi:hypothetical protein
MSNLFDFISDASKAYVAQREAVALAATGPYALTRSYSADWEARCEARDRALAAFDATHEEEYALYLAEFAAYYAANDAERESR